MRIARFSHDGDVAFGVVEGDDVAELVSHPFGPVGFTGNRWPLSAVRLLAPVLPSKVVAIGKNYAEHASEMGGEVPEAPLIFLKPSTAVVGDGDPIAYPPSSQRVDYEGELAVVIGPNGCPTISASSTSPSARVSTTPNATSPSLLYLAMRTAAA